MPEITPLMLTCFTIAGVLMLLGARFLYKALMGDMGHARALGMLCIGFSAVIILGYSTLSERRAQIDGFLASISSTTVARPLSSDELLQFGGDISEGIILGESDQAHRLHCIRFFDGKKKALLLTPTGNLLPVDMDYCKHTQI